MKSIYHIRKLTLNNLDEYIRLRQEGVRLDPVGFGTVYTTENQVPRWLHASFLVPSCKRSIWGAFRGEVLIGMIRLEDENEEGGACRTISSLYVCPASRRCGIERNLLRQAIHAAACDPMAAEIHLNVSANNHGARALFHSVGFHEYAMEEKASDGDGQLSAEYRMRQFLPNRPKMAERGAPDKMSPLSYLAAASGRPEFEALPVAA